MQEDNLRESVSETTETKFTDTDIKEDTHLDAYDAEVDDQISRMMGEGGVAPPVQPRAWKNWARDKDERKHNDEHTFKD